MVYLDTFLRFSADRLRLIAQQTQLFNLKLLDNFSFQPTLGGVIDLHNEIGNAFESLWHGRRGSQDDGAQEPQEDLRWRCQAGRRQLR